MVGAHAVGAAVAVVGQVLLQPLSLTKSFSPTELADASSVGVRGRGREDVPLTGCELLSEGGVTSYAWGFGTRGREDVP